MDILNTVVVTLLALGILITVHEWGHFWVARRCGVKVLRFSLGFGKALLRWRDRHGTEFVLTAIPLGGYVKMLDSRVDEVLPEDQAQDFNRQSLAKRTAIVAAGPIANFLLAIVLFYVLFLGGVNEYRAVINSVAPQSIAANAGIQPGTEIIAINGQALESRQALNRALLDYYGEALRTLTLTTRPVRHTGSTQTDALVEDTSGLNTLAKQAAEKERASIQTHQVQLSWDENSQHSPLELLGIELYAPAVTTQIARVLRYSAADEAGLAAGDTLLTLDQQPLNAWRDWASAIQASPGKVMNIGLERAGKYMNLQVIPHSVKADSKSIGQLGVVPKMQEWPQELRLVRDYSVFSAWQPAIQETTDKTLLTLGMLKKMLFAQVSIKQIGGPISIAQQANLSAKLGWQSYIGLIALLSISLGVLNLLPIPVLDGGHLCFYAIEAIKGSPVSERHQTIAFQIGALLVFGFMLFAIYNDISRL